MPSFPSFPASLPGDGVILRPAAERDIPEILIAHQDDPELFAALRMRRPPSASELGRRTETADSERAVGARLWLTILAPGSDECRGQFDVHEAELQHGRADVQVWVAPGHRRRGLGSAALALGGRWLIEQAGLERVQLLIAPGNAAMLATAERAGFHREGLLRSHWRERHGRADAEVWSLIRRDLASGG
ncbi:MAG TPA: GNAT family protein [Solirubrobacteraceae bacterium]|nr:GNAT family protein [Solirubrobacteraceae bacterium]